MTNSSARALLGTEGDRSVRHPVGLEESTAKRQGSPFRSEKRSEDTGGLLLFIDSLHEGGAQRIAAVMYASWRLKPSPRRSDVG